MLLLLDQPLPTYGIDDAMIVCIERQHDVPAYWLPTHLEQDVDVQGHRCESSNGFTDMRRVKAPR